MFGALAKSIFGSSNERYVKSLGKVIDQIAAFEPTIQAMSDDELVSQTARFRERLANGETLDGLLPEAFATVREASVRVLGIAAKSPKCAPAKARRWWRRSPPI